MSDANAVVAESALPVLGPHDEVECPLDELRFRPFYSEGVCPICGWRPEGYTVARPWTHRADWALLAFLALVVASIVMAVIVIRVAT
jgi:hypothetical protein